MSEIKWVNVTDTIREAFEGDVRIGMVELYNSDWHWRMLVDDGCELQPTRGMDYSEQYAKLAVEHCRSDQVARSGRGILRWTSVSMSDWLAFSGKLQVGGVVRSANGYTVIRRWDHEDKEAQTLQDGRRMVEEWWGNYLRIADLVPRHLAANNQQH